MNLLRLLLLLAAFLLFLIAGFNIGSPRFQLVAFGLACYMLHIILGMNIEST